MTVLDAKGPITPRDFQAIELADLATTPEGEGAKFSVTIANNTPLSLLAPHFARLGRIVLTFPAFSDGRGFTLARRLRQAGFKGALRASGPLIADQFAYALACGFDEIEISESMAARQPPQHWQRARRATSAGYQRGYRQNASILDERRAARRAAESKALANPAVGSPQ